MEECYLPDDLKFGIMISNKLESIASRMPEEAAKKLKSAFKRITLEYNSLSAEQLYQGLVNFEADEKLRRGKIEKISYEKAYENGMGRIQNSLRAETEFKEEFREFVSW